MSEHFELRCRECGRARPGARLPARQGQATEDASRAYCEDCFAPLEVVYDFDRLRGRLTRERIAARPANLWRYAELLPVDAAGAADDPLPVGFTPLVRAPRLAARLGSPRLFIKNDAVCFPTLSFKDRVVAVALERARALGFDTVGCSSTGNLANALAAQAARGGFTAFIFVPAGVEPTKITATQVYGARVVPVAGTYDQVNRLCSELAEERRWGFVNVNLRPYYTEGSKTVGFEIAEQLGWRLPDNVVVPMAGGALICQIGKAFDELVALELVAPKPVKFFGAQAAGCSPISTAVKRGQEQPQPQKPATICHSLAIGNPADGLYAVKTIRTSGGWAEDASDEEIIRGIGLLAETEGIFSETAGGVTVAAAEKLAAAGRILPGETTVLCVTGNGLKTTEALHRHFGALEAIPPRRAAFEAWLGESLEPVKGA